MNPFFKDLYTLFISKDLDFSKRIRMFLHIKNDSSEVCKYLKNHPVIDSKSLKLEDIP